MIGNRMPSFQKSHSTRGSIFSSSLEKGSGGAAYGGVGDPYEAFDSSSSAVEYISSDIERSWSNTPNYRALVKSGSPLPVQPFSFRSRSVSGAVSCHKYLTYPGFDFRKGVVFFEENYSAPLGAIGFSLPLGDTSIISDDEVILKVRSSLQSSRTWRAPLALAEAGKSSEMIYSAAERIVRGLRAARRLDVKGLYDALPVKRGRGARPSASHTAASMWLEHRYGWLPLMSDVRDAANSVADLTQRWGSSERPQKVRVSMYRSDSRVVDAPPVGGSKTIRSKANVYTSESKRAVLSYSVSDQSSYAASSLGLTNPLAVAWELVPFSFVADWFAPIGDYLNTLDAGVGISIHSLHIAYKRHVQSTFYGGSSDYWTSVDISGSQDTLTVVRGPATTTLPSVVPSNLSLQLGLSATRLTSAVALMRNLTGK